MYRIRRKLYSQNFLYNRKLVKKLIGKSSIGKNDTAIEIGPGKGIITEELSKRAKKVIAVELDAELAKKLSPAFKNTNVTIICQDIRTYQLPQGQYKVFANIPFGITADIVHKLLDSLNPPIDCYLVVQKEAAEKFAGEPKETQFPLLAKPFFEFSIVWHFKRSDFTPQPDIDVAFLRVKKREVLLFSKEELDMYREFVTFAFGTWKKNLKVGLKRLFTYNQWKRLAKDNGFSIYSKPTDLDFEQWVAIFKFYNQPETNKRC